MNEMLARFDASKEFIVSDKTSSCPAGVRRQSLQTYRSAARRVTPGRASCTTMKSPRNPVLFREGIEAARSEFDD